MTQGSVGIDFEIGAQLTAKVDKLSQQVGTLQDRQDRLAQGITPFSVTNIPLTLSSGAGTLNVPNMLGPLTGEYWDLRRISCTGFTAGTVTVTLSASQAEIVAVFSAAGVLLIGKGQLLLNSNDNLYFTASGITGSVTISFAGIRVSSPLIGDYLL